MIGKNKQPDKWVRFLIILPITAILIIGISAAMPEKSKTSNNDVINQNINKDLSSNENELRKRAKSIIGNDTFLKDFYCDFSFNKDFKFSMILKDNCVYGVYLITKNQDDQVSAIVKSPDEVKSKFEKNLTMNKVTKISPELTAAYHLFIENLKATKTEAILVLTLKELKNKVEVLNNTTTDTVKTKKSSNQNVDDVVFTVVEQMPDFPGEPESFRNFIAENLIYPKNAADKGIQGKVFIQFIVEKDGQLSNFKVLRSADPLLDQEALRVVKLSPKWNPGMQRGKAVRVSFTFPIVFSLEKKETNTTEINEEEVFTVVEEMPKFGDNDMAFRKFIADNLKYPEDAAKAGVEGRVFVQFTISKEGELIDPKVIRGTHKSLDEEAIRVIKTSPKWTPGKQRGQNVNVQFTMPIVFALGENKK